MNDYSSYVHFPGEEKTINISDNINQNTNTPDTHIQQSNGVYLSSVNPDAISGNYTNNGVAYGTMENQYYSGNKINASTSYGEFKIDISGADDATLSSYGYVNNGVSSGDPVGLGSTEAMKKALQDYINVVSKNLNIVASTKEIQTAIRGTNAEAEVTRYLKELSDGCISFINELKTYYSKLDDTAATYKATDKFTI